MCACLHVYVYVCMFIYLFMHVYVHEPSIFLDELKLRTSYCHLSWLQCYENVCLL